MLPQDFFEAHPHFAQRFPGGIAEFAQIAGQLPEDMLEDLMIAEVAAGQDRGMPGQMPGEGIFDDDVPQAAQHVAPRQVNAQAAGDVVGALARCNARANRGFLLGEEYGV